MAAFRSSFFSGRRGTGHEAEPTRATPRSAMLLAGEENGRERREVTRPRRRRRFFFVGCGEPSTSQRGRRRLNGAGRGGGGESLEVNVYLLEGVRTKVKVKVVGVRAGVRVLTQWYVVVVVMPVFRYVVMILVPLAARCGRVVL